MTGRLVSVVLLALISTPPGAWAEEESDLDLRGEITAGARFYVLESPFDDDDVTSFFDQYRFIDTKEDAVPWFADAFHLDTGLFRDDGTTLIRAERWSSNWLNERAEIDIDWKGLDVDFDYSRLRTADLRVFPNSTRGRFPTDSSSYAANFQSDVDEPLEPDRKLFTRRNTADGQVEFFADDFGLGNPVLESARLYSRYQKRNGFRQDRFLLDATRELGSTGQNRQRFRANRRKFDQEVVVVGGGVTAEPAGLFTSVLDVNFERFREHAPTIDLGDLAAEQPKLGTDLTTAQADRAIMFVPDTNRISGSLRLSRRLGDTTFQGGSSISHVEQAGRKSPLQDLRDVGDTDVTDYAVHVAFDTPLAFDIPGFDIPVPGWVAGLDLGVGGFVKYRRRENHFDYKSDLELIADDFRGAADGQVDPFLKNRDQVDGELELTYRPTAGAKVAAGYRLHYVDRDWRYADPPGSLQPQVGLEDDESEIHTAFLNAGVRLGSRSRVSGELGLSWAPHTGFPREFEESQYFEGRASTAFPRIFASSLSIFGRVENGSNDDFRVQGESDATTQRKKFERLDWNTGVTLQAMPIERTSFYTAFVHTQDHQQFRHVRSNIPRYDAPPGLDFFLDSRIDYDANVDVLSLGTSTEWTDWLDTRISATLTWVEADFHSDSPDGSTYSTGSVVDDVDDINSRIASAEAGVGLQVLPNVRIDLGYRFDQYRDLDDHDPINLDENVHTTTFAVTVELP